MQVIRSNVDGSLSYVAKEADGADLTTSLRPVEWPEPTVPVAPTKVLTVFDAFGTEDSNGPLRFGQKATSALIGPGEPIVHPADVTELWAEGELGVVIGRRCRNIEPGDAPAHVFGFVCVNDITALDFARRDAFRCKSQDTFAPIGPHIETSVTLDDVDAGLELITRVNGEVRQHGSTKNTRFRVSEVISIASTIATLLPGDVISLGTPPPPPVIRPGDVVEVEVERVGRLANPVVAATEVVS